MNGDPDLPLLERGGIKVWDATVWFPTKSGGNVVFRPRTATQIEETAIHHDAVTFDGRDLNFNGTTVDEERGRMQASYNWHTKFWPSASYTPGQGWNWPGMGYHLYCFPSGRIYLVGDILSIRAHVAYRNTRSTGIVGAGDFTRERPDGLLVTAYGQAAAWSWLVRGAALPLEGHRIWAGMNAAGVRSVWATSCPGDTYEKWIPDVRRIANLEYARAATPVPPVEEDQMKLIQESGSPFVFIQWGVWYSYLHRMADAVELGIPTVIETVAAGTLKSLSRADVGWWANL